MLFHAKLWFSQPLAYQLLRETDVCGQDRKGIAAFTTIDFDHGRNQKIVNGGSVSECQIKSSTIRYRCREEDSLYKVEVSYPTNHGFNESLKCSPNSNRDAQNTHRLL